MEVTVLGNVGHKLPVAALSIDQILPSALNAQHSSQKDRPFPQFSNVSIQNATLGDSKYFAGLAKLEKRFSHGVSFGVNYTWSHFLGNINDGGVSIGAENGPFSNYYNRRADWGDSPNDIRQRVSLNWLYELPFGKGKRWLSTNPLRYVAGGWSLGSVATIQTGAPITIVDQTNNCNCFSSGSQRPNLIVNPNLSSGQRTVAAWFNTAAFAQPAPYTFGSEGVGVVRAPGLVNVDMSLLRNFRVTEKIHAELRGEFFNSLNHTNLGLPGQSFGSAAFGVISTAGPARQIELGMRVIF
jgi:hypothetical protein